MDSLGECEEETVERISENSEQERRCLMERKRKKEYCECARHSCIGMTGERVSQWKDKACLVIREYGR